MSKEQVMEALRGFQIKKLFVTSDLDKRQHSTVNTPFFSSVHLFLLVDCSVI